MSMNYNSRQYSDERGRAQQDHGQAAVLFSDWIEQTPIHHQFIPLSARPAHADVTACRLADGGWCGLPTELSSIRHIIIQADDE